MEGHELVAVTSVAMISREVDVVGRREADLVGSKEADLVGRKMDDLVGGSRKVTEDVAGNRGVEVHGND